MEGLQQVDDSEQAQSDGVIKRSRARVSRTYVVDDGAQAEDAVRALVARAADAG